MSDDNASPPPRPIKIAGLELSRKAALAIAVVALYVAGAAVAIGYSHAGSGQGHAGSATPTAAASGPVNRCWDGSGVDRGKRCSTEYDANVLFWAFGVDANEADCERSPSYEWSDVGVKCEYKGTELRMATWRSAAWRDRRLVEYGKASPAGRGLMVQAPGQAGRALIRYDSDTALLYASVKAKDADVLQRLLPKVKSLTELVYGSKATSG
ncbi:MAG: hypothetical protein ACJ71Z_00565 [Aeromicrobium sp.]